MTAQERLDFTMHPNLLVSVIKSQAGTLSKALLEGVMNSIDAGATRVDVTVTQQGFTISDNGRGFTSEEEVREFFGRFGTPHTEGDARYGRFRMGRGQMMAFAKTLWRSGPFQMEVDIEREGLSYKLSRLEKPVKGCVIEGQLYEQLPSWKLTDTLSELKKFVAFTPVPVYVNERLFGASPARLSSWTYEDEYAYYRIVPSAETLQVYNLGVFVEDIPLWQIGCGGIVVSKKALEVNFARNSIMRERCPVWNRIQIAFEGLVFARLLQARSLSNAERKYLAHRISLLPRCGQFDWRGIKLLTDPSGRHLPLSALKSFRKFVLIDDSETLACAAHGTDGTFVVTGQLLDRFGVSTLTDWLDRMHDLGVLPSDYEIIDPDSLSQLGLGNTCQLDPSGLPRRDAAAFAALTTLNAELAAQLVDIGIVPKVRELRVGTRKAGSFEAWTDGKEYVTVNRRYLKLMARGIDGVHHWLLTLVHEYMHDVDDSESHAHDEVFYRKFHDVLCSGRLNLASLARTGLEEYLKELRARGLPRPRHLTRQLRG